MKTLSLAACLVVTGFAAGQSAAPAPAAPPNSGAEVLVPAGWDLSAALALFRNLPLFDPAGFPETEGPVLCRFGEARNASQDGLSFTNTYEFFRATRDGQFLHLSIQEISRTGQPGGLSQPAMETVADTRQDLAILPALPPGASTRPELSPLIAFVLDHRVPLVDSEAGKLARTLNYTKEGKVRPGNYVQPRVTYLLHSGAIAKVRIFGLEALLTDSARASLKGGKAVENCVLELSVDGAGAAHVVLVPLGAPEKTGSR